MEVDRDPPTAAAVGTPRAILTPRDHTRTTTDNISERNAAVADGQSPAEFYQNAIPNEIKPKTQRGEASTEQLGPPQIKRREPQYQLLRQRLDGLCRNWYSVGFCRWGTNCRNIHYGYEDIEDHKNAL